MPRKRTQHPLLALMQERKLTYRQAAKLLKCHHSTVHHTCTGISKPDPKLASRIVKWSGGAITFEQLYGG